MGIRVIKTAAAAIAAIYTAYYLGLEPPLSAGILAILGVEVTRMKGLQSAFSRFLASVLGLFFASFIFTVLGFHYWVLAIFILVTFPVLARVQLKEGILTSSVIVFHLFDHGRVDAAILGNEVMLLLVGLGWATVINLVYMPKEEEELNARRADAEENFSSIFREMAHTLRDPSHVWDGGELLVAHRSIEAGTQLAIRYRENRLYWNDSPYWPTYFEMRRQQLDTIQQMLAELALVYEKWPQGELIAELLDGLASDVKADVYVGVAEQRVFELMASFRSMELPKTRDEFEIRAALLTLLHEVDRYLVIAKRLKKKPETAKAGTA
ncbi:aromatic acid exporter family protein [Paenibacillus sp. LHD-117]|uniref:aromatic acid exporter family protein n=1 Tax=Paenibacillus sp. LHD-117 TaxID=3071412 RepID=UPI0027E1504A|nr:aromatic acid exporter family protein [Paenibacillus sp. LHD-117]MDQ6418118.1 aromatic acid exporter family protein [Paenibacillus sp. LHD-117]